MKNSASFDTGYTIFAQLALTPSQFIHLSNGINLNKMPRDDVRLIQSTDGLTHLIVTHESVEFSDPEPYRAIVQSALKDDQVASYAHFKLYASSIITSAISFNAKQTVDTPVNASDLALAGAFLKDTALEYVTSTAFHLDADTAETITKICEYYQWGDFGDLELIQLLDDKYCFASVSSDHGVLDDEEGLESDPLADELGENLDIEFLFNRFIKPLNPDLTLEVTGLYIGADGSKYYVDTYQ